jgi:HNH endonuclease
MSDLPDSIAYRIIVDPVSGCWKVAGNPDRDGYARIGGEGAHRVVYKLLVGPIPEGMVLDHVEVWGCTWRCCAWPAHLEPVTPGINTLRGRSFSAINARKDRCDNGHEYDLLNTYYRPNGHRDCRACILARVKKYQQSKRESALDLRLAA